MTKTIKRRLGIPIVIALLVGVGVLSVDQMAQATSGTVSGHQKVHGKTHNYPPKTKLSLVANRATVPVTQKVTLTAFHVGPGCQVKFTFGSQTAYTGSHAGQASWTFKSTATSGVIHASASTYNCAYHETAYTSVRASSPAIKLPPYVKKNQWFHVTIYQFPALSSIQVRVYNSTFSKTVTVTTGSGGTSSPSFEVPHSGSYVVVASGHGAYASTVLNAHS